MKIYKLHLQNREFTMIFHLYRSSIFSFHHPSSSLLIIFIFTHLQNSETNSLQIFHKTNRTFSCKTQKSRNSWLQLMIGMMENTQKHLWQTKTNSMISVCGETMCCCQANDCTYIQVQFCKQKYPFHSYIIIFVIIIIIFMD
jgi:hypothetical protein